MMPAQDAGDKVSREVPIYLLRASFGSDPI